MKKTIYISVLLILLTLTANAQQMPLSSLYTVNRFQVNSAYAGFNGCLEGYLSHREQWAGMPGAPVTNYLSIHSGIAKNMALGINLIMDKTDIISKMKGSLSYAYRVKLGNQQNLRFGLSAGIYQLSLSTLSAIVDDPSDVIVQSGNQSSIAFNNDFSIYYNYKKLQIGVSVPQIVESNAKFDLNNGEGGFGLKRHIIGYAEYDFAMGESFSFKPSALYKTVNGKQGQLDINGQLNYKKLFFVGAGYRTAAGLLARLGVNLKDKFTIAYAYEFAAGNMSTHSGRSHEIMVGVKFCKKSKPVIIIEEVIVPAPVVEVPITESELVVVSDTEKEDVVRKVFDVNGANAEFNKRKNIIRYGKSDSKKSLSGNEQRLENYVVEVLTNNPSLSIRVEGHTCDLGSYALNQELSEQRAVRIARKITEKGIDVLRVSAVGKGESSPRKPNTSEVNRIENRRVQFVFSN